MTLLSQLPIALSARVKALRIDSAHARFLRAVGIFEDERVVVLRRAPFGGPLHVRTSSGGEFALDLTLAKAIDVDTTEATRPGRPKPPGDPTTTREAAE